MLRAGLVSYLSAVQDVASCTGLAGFCRSRRGMPTERTIYRWHHRLGASLVVSPVFAVEGLGLSHVHAFIANPSSGWEGFPYAVERSWVTPDCATRVLYLHCVVPSGHEAAALDSLRAVGNCEVFTSGTGWERLLPNPGWAVPSLDYRPRGAVSLGLLREIPLVVPSIFEGWRETLSLDKTWRRIKDRLGPVVREYVPGQRYCATNGKRHVKRAYDALSAEGLFVQYAAHYRVPGDGVEAFVRVDRRVAPGFVEKVRDECTLLATHPGGEECLFRVAGTARLVDVLMECGVTKCYWVNRRATDDCPVRVRFAYERLFDPRLGSWVLPEAND